MEVVEVEALVEVAVQVEVAVLKVLVEKVTILVEKVEVKGGGGDRPDDEFSDPQLTNIIVEPTTGNTLQVGASIRIIPQFDQPVDDVGLMTFSRSGGDGVGGLNGSLGGV